MAETIKYNPEQLRTWAATMMNYANAYGDIIDKLKNKIEVQLPENWKGNAFEKMLASAQAMLAAFGSLDETLLSYAAVLTKAADNMETVDRHYETKIKGI